jgi:hypothetical protein
MIRKSRFVFVIGGVLVAALPWLALSPSNAGGQATAAQKDEPRAKPGLKKIAIKTFMRKKLEASQSIIEGLAMEDFGLIESGAKQLRTMSGLAEFMSVDNPLYTEHADDFRRTVAKLEKAAREKRIDGSTLAFVDMTMNCVECHKFVRTILVAQ